MKLVFLSENSVVADGLKGEHGTSVYVEKDNIKLVFDCGYFGAAGENAEKLGIDLSQVNVVAFSHNHVDHAGGFVFMKDKFTADVQILLHQGFHTRKYWDHRFDPETDPTAAKNLEMVCPAMPLEWFFTNGKFGMRIIADDLYKISDDVYLVANFPVQRGIEAVFPASRMETSAGEYVVDEFRDEQACVIRVKEGLVVLSGCAHNGIMNILETIKKHFPGENIVAIFGGTHLVPYNPQRVEETVKYFNESGIKYAGVCHCTGPAIADFANKVTSYIKTGSGLTLEFED